MADKKVNVNLSRPVTYKGVNYPAGETDMPEEAAKLAVKKKFGRIAGEVDQAEFTPLSVEETMKRFGEMDFADEVMKSMQFHKEALAAQFGRPGMSPNGGASDGDVTGKEKITEGLPEDFPMRHVFVELGFKTVEEIQTKTREELIALNGIGETSADKALAYGK